MNKFTTIFLTVFTIGLFTQLKCVLSEVTCYTCNSLENDYCKDDFDKNNGQVDTCTGVACYKKKMKFRNSIQEVVRGCKQKVVGKTNDCDWTRLPTSSTDLYSLRASYCVCNKDKCNSSNLIKITPFLPIILCFFYKFFM